MTIISTLCPAALEISLANPLVFIYLGLATMHLVPAYYHLMREGIWPLAICYALISTFYIAVAIMHGVAAH